MNLASLSCAEGKVYNSSLTGSVYYVLDASGNAPMEHLPRVQENNTCERSPKSYSHSSINFNSTYGR